jgi:hypothetical protein
VYGPPDPTVKTAILTFCIVAVIGFMIETIQNADDLLVKKKIPFLSQPLTNFILIVFEDIPILILNLMITVCRDGEPTVIAVVKASVCIGVVIIRVTLMIIYHWFIDVKKNRFEVIMDAMNTVGLIAIGSLSIAIQLLNSFPTNSNGLIQAADPATFSRMNYVTSKYLNNVGIFVNWPINNNNTENENYIWIADITEVINNTYLPIQIKTNYSDSSSNYIVCFIKIKSKSKADSCYQINNLTYSTYLNSTDAKSFTNLKTTYEIEFTKEPALYNTYLIGYIDYNLNIITGFNSTNCEQTSASSIIYARFLYNSEITNIQYLRNNYMAGYSFYNLKTDLVTVDKIWKTGIIGCENRGDLGPKLNHDIHLTC